MNVNQRPDAGAATDLNGVFVIDKPVNISSAGAVAAVKRVLHARKVGHAGTLDPWAEGVLICCVNQATRLAAFLLHGKKKYIAVLKLGQETDTQDSTGAVVSFAKSVDYPRQTIESTVESFQGPIEQLPPIYSALKHQGVPLYKLARRGQAVQKPPRRVHIYDIRVHDIKLPYVRFEVSCSGGTYIRTLGADIGKKLGCGGHLNALKRIESSGFKLNQAIPLSAFEKLARSGKLSQKLISMTDALPDIPGLCADEHLVRRIRQGQKLRTIDLHGLNNTEGVPKKAQYIKIVDHKEGLVAILEQNTVGDRLRYCCVFH